MGNASATSRQSRSANRLTPASAFIFGLAVLLATIVMSYAPVEAQPAIQAAGHGNPWITLYDGKEASSGTAAGRDGLLQQLQANGAQPVSLTSADFNLDGFQDLVIGYAQGSFIVRYADPQKFTSQFIDADPFGPELNVLSAPMPADFVAALDFDGDGYPDVLSASRGGAQVFLFHNHSGTSFDSPESIELPGKVTSLAANDRYGKRIAIAVTGAGGSALLIFQQHSDLIHSKPRIFTLPAAATELDFNVLDDDPWPDLAFIAEGSLYILHGMDAQDVASDNRIERIPLSYSVSALCSGDFIPDKQNKMEIAVLTNDGTVRILSRGHLDSSPLTEAEILERRLAVARAREEGYVAQIVPWRRNSSDAWTEAQRIAIDSNSTNVRLVTANVASSPGEEVIVLDPKNSRIRVLINQPDQKSPLGALSKNVVTFNVAGNPTALLPMRLNVMAQPGFVLLRRGQMQPVLVPSAPAATFTVSKTTDTNDGTCNADCSLREAIVASNASAGADIIQFGLNGTFTLTISSGGSFDNVSATGDLDINDSLTINGNGTANTVISTTYTAACGDCKVFGINQTGLFPSLSVAFNNMTIQNGFNNGNPGFCGQFWETGGGVDFFLTGTGTNYSMTNVIVNNNRTIDCSQSHGGGVNVDGASGSPAHPNLGAVAFANCTFTNNIATHEGGGLNLFSDVHDVTVSGSTLSGNATIGTGGGEIGGGIDVRHSFGGTVTVTGGTIQNNTAAGAGGGISVAGNQHGVFNGLTITGNTSAPAGGINSFGGGIAFIMLSLAGFTPTYTINSLIIATNHANTGGINARGGGVYFGSGGGQSTFSMTGGSIIGNNTTGKGGGIYVDFTLGGASTGLSNLGTLNLSNMAIQGNPAGTDGGGLYVNRAKMNLSNVIVSSNVATGNGGGIAHLFAQPAGGPNLNNACTLSIDGGSVDTNTATLVGGGIYFDSTSQDPAGSTLTIGGTTLTPVTDNKANGNGGGFAISNSAVANLTRTTIRGNKADNDNNNVGDGGGIFNNGGSITVSNNGAIGGLGPSEPNSAHNGGGVFNAIGTLTYNGIAPGGGTILANTATGNGGGVHVSGGTVILSNLSIRVNLANSGGALFVGGGTLNAALSRISSNSATTGSAITQTAGTATVENNWWACDGFPNAPGCQTGSGTFDADPRIDLRLTASPTSVPLAGSSALTTDVTLNTNGAPTAGGNAPMVLVGLNLIFGGTLLGGSISPAMVVPVPSGGTVANTYTADNQCGTAQPSVSLDNGTQSVSVAMQCPDMTVSKTGTAASTCDGTISYTLTANNIGTLAGDNVSVTDDLADCLTAVTCNSAQGTCSVGAGNIITASLGTVNNGSSVIITVNGTVTVACGSSVVNAAASVSTTTPETDTTNNTSGTVTTTITCADVAIGKTGPATAGCGQPVTYTLSPANLGTAAASNVSVLDDMADCLSSVSVTGCPAGWSCSIGAGNTLTATIASLGAGASTNIVVQGTATAACTPGFSNAATISTTSTESNTGNNGPATVNTVVACTDLSLTKVVDNATPNVGDAIAFTVTLLNSGPSNGTGISVRDLIPVGLTFVSATPGQGTYDNLTGLWSVGNVNNGANTTLVINATVTAGAVGGVTNTAEVIAAGESDPDSTPANGNPAEDDQASATVTPLVADLSLVKLVNNATPDVGETITFTITLSNAGANPATGVVVHDLIPAGLNFVSATPSQGTYSSITGDWNVGTVNVGSNTAQLVIQAVVVGTSIITNTVEVTVSPVFDPDSTPGNGVPAEDDQSSVSLSPQVADLSLTKIVNNPTPNVGDSITFTITLTNSGPNPANGVIVHDLLPAGLTFVSATPSTGSYNSGTGDWTVGTIANGSNATLAINATVATAGAKINTAEVTASDTFDPDSTPGNGNPAEDDQASATVTPMQADLSLTKTVDDPFPIPGQNIVFTITVSNAGPNNATGVTVLDQLPATLTFVSATPSQGSYNNVSGIWNIGTINTAANATLQITATVADNTVKINTAQVSGSAVFDPDSTPNNNNPAEDDQASVTITPINADLAVTKSDSPDPVIAGQNITYTINYINNGPDPAANVTVTDATPPGTTFVSAQVLSGTGWSISSPPVGGTGNVVFSKNPSANGDTSSFEIVVNVTASEADGTVISNTATAASTTNDADTANNTATATTTVNARADLSMTKSDSPDPVLAGTNITYSLNFTSNGPSDAQSVSVDDATPPGTTFVSATAPAGWTSTTPPVGGTGTITFTKATVISAETAAFTIVVHVNANVADGTVVSNTATATSTTTDPDNSNNSATATTTVQSRADLSVTKSDAPDPVIAGTNITYTINFASAGPSDAQAVLVADTVPANTTFVSATASPGWTTTTPPVGGTGNISFTKGSVSAGETAIFTIVVNVNANTANGSVITNTVTAASTTTDPNPADNAATTTTTVMTFADLSVVKTDAPDPVDAGADITYTINFANSGPSDAQNVSVTDATPAGTTFVSATAPAGWTTTAPPVGGTGNITFAKTPVAGSETAIFTIVVKVNSDTADGTVITNTAVTTSSTTDPNVGNNSSTTTTGVQVSADLSLVKTDSPDPVAAGTNLTYTIDYTNNGPSDAQNISITDAVPPNTTFVSATAPAGWASTTPPVGGTGTVTFTKATTTADETAQFQIVVAVGVSTPDGTVISNTAGVTTDTADPDSANNTSTATTTVNAISDLVVDKSDAVDPVFAGGNETYTINFVSNGPSDAQNVIVSDPTPANTTFVSATAPAGWTTTTPPVGGTGTVTFTKATVVVGETASFQIVVNVDSGTSDNTTLSNTVTAASDSADPDNANNTDTETTLTHEPTDLEITKTDGITEVSPGQNVTYTIVATNLGTRDDPAAVVDDTFPPELLNVSWICSASGGATCSPSGTGNINDTVSLPNGSSVTYTVDAMVDFNTTGVVANTATVTPGAGVFDPDLSNNTATDSDSIACLFCDEFDDSTLDPNWTYIKKIADWSEDGANLIGTTTNKSRALATPIFAGCATCTVMATLQSSGGPPVSLIAWYTDDDNFLELLMKQSNGRWILKHHTGGHVSVKEKFNAGSILPNTPYVVRINFDGVQFRVFINNSATPDITLTPIAPPNGTVGFKVKNATGTFGFIRVF